MKGVHGARPFRRHLQESTSLIPARAGVGALFVVKVCAPTMTSRWSDLITLVFGVFGAWV